MAGTTLSTTSGITDQIQRYFDKKLLTQTLKTIVLDQFAYKAALPGEGWSQDDQIFPLPGIRNNGCPGCDGRHVVDTWLNPSS
jgi:hypothetical protein